MALPWLFALLISGLIRGAPVVKVGAPSWLVLAFDIVYVTVIYALLGWGERGQRRMGGDGRLAMIVLAVDGMLRLGAGLFFALFLPAAFAGQSANHVARALAMVAGGLGLALRGGGIYRPAFDLSPRALSRWAGWIVTYVVLIVIKVATHS